MRQLSRGSTGRFRFGRHGSIVRAVLDCPTLDERRAGRLCLLDGPGQALVTDVEIDGTVARITLRNAVGGLEDLWAPDMLFTAIDTTVFATFAAVDRIEYALGVPSGAPDQATNDPNALCRLTGASDGCGFATREQWAAIPDGWRAAPVLSPDMLGSSADVHPKGPVRVGDVTVEVNGGVVRAVGGTGVRALADGARRWWSR